MVALVLIVAGAGYELTKSHSSSPPAVATPVVAPAPATHLTLAAALAQAMANGLAENSVHVTARSVTPSHGALLVTQDDAVTGGVQHISAKSIGHVTIRVIGPTTYFTADRRGFIKFFGLTASQALVVRGLWVPVVQGEQGYASLTDGVTLSSTLSQMKLAGRLKRLPEQTRDGQRVYGIRGIATGQGSPPHTISTVWITVGAHPLPVEADESSTKGTSVARLSHWGRPVTMQEPARVASPGGLSG